MRLGFFLYDDLKQARAAAPIMQQAVRRVHEERLLARGDQPAGGHARRARSIALDAKMVIDDNELDRRPEIAALRDDSAEAPSEVEARKANLTFIKLDGNVGCVVNGAGLAMATMDLVKYYGGEPANFLDIGGSSNPGEGRERAAHHHRRSQREGDPVQHLRRHHAHRRRGQRHRRRHQDESAQGADRDPADRHQRGDRDEDSAGERLLARRPTWTRPCSGPWPSPREGRRREHLHRSTTPPWSCRASPAATVRSTRSR